MGGWLDEQLDHGMILERGDAMIPMLQEGRMKVFVMDSPPTAENIVRVVFEHAEKLLLPRGVRLESVRCWETPTSCADYP